MSEAVIVSTARTPIGKAFRGAFNMTHGATLGGHVLKHAVERAGIDPGEVEDVVLGCATPEKATGSNIARLSAIRAGCPVTVSGVTVNRFCSSGLQSIALAAQRIVAGEAGLYVAGGVQSISCVQNELNKHMLRDSWINENKPALYWPMLQTAETVASRYSISRERQDEYGVRSQLRASAAEAAGHFKAEIVATTATMATVDKDSGRLSSKTVTVERDEGLRADTTYEAVSKIKPALPGGTIAAGNASQFSDGAGACVLMSSTLASKRGLQPLGIFRGFAIAG